MAIIESQVDRNGDDYKRNREKMLAAIQEFRDAEASVQAASEKSRERFKKRKQLMPRERIALLLDRGAPFLELMPLAGYRMHDDKDGSSAGGAGATGCAGGASTGGITWGGDLVTQQPAAQAVSAAGRSTSSTCSSRLPRITSASMSSGRSASAGSRRQSTTRSPESSAITMTA